MVHNLAHAVFLLSKISFSTKPTVILSFSTAVRGPLRLREMYQIEGYFWTDPNGLIILNMRHK